MNYHLFQSRGDSSSYVSVVWLGLLVGLLAVGTKTASNALAGFGEPIPYIGLPYTTLYEGDGS